MGKPADTEPEVGLAARFWARQPRGELRLRGDANHVEKVLMYVCLPSLIFKAALKTKDNQRMIDCRNYPV